MKTKFNSYALIIASIMLVLGAFLRVANYGHLLGLILLLVGFFLGEITLIIMMMQTRKENEELKKENEILKNEQLLKS
jgi:hypothetical protein